MGPKTESKIMMFVDGELLDFRPENLPEFTAPEDYDALETGVFSLTEPIEFSVTFKISKNGRCKTRKRLVKLLMSRGFSRNDANVLARSVKKKTRKHI